MAVVKKGSTVATLLYLKKNNGKHLLSQVSCYLPEKAQIYLKERIINNQPTCASNFTFFKMFSATSKRKARAGDVAQW